MRHVARLGAALWLLVCVTASAGVSFQVVESLPLTDFDLLPVPGELNTTAALVGLIESANHTLDVTAMYWSLLAQSDHLTPAELARLGSGTGKAVYQALDDAASRGVQLRFVNGAGISSSAPAELLQLQAKHLSIQSRTWNATAWYGGGIMHQKVWVADRGAAVYLGSANMDWLSLSQVKELGVLIKGGERSPEGAPVCGSPQALFEKWWDWAGMNPDTKVAFDFELHVQRKLPSWSLTVPAESRGADPFAEAGQNCTEPEGPGAYMLSAAPREMLGPAPEREGIPRTHWDLDMITTTIYNATETVDLSVMDILPSNMYGKDMGYVVWNRIFDALSTAAVTNGVRVRLLISNWEHTSAREVPYLQSLLHTTNICKIRDQTAEFSDEPICKGSLEIKLFRVPGWNETVAPDAPFMPYSRVNHAKYVVTNLRANIGTSNMQWGYFYNTAGMSVNTADEGVVTSVQAVFNRDWESSYATSITV